MPSRRQIVLGTAALAVLAAAGGVAATFRQARTAARRAVAPGLARRADTRHGPVEFAEAGNGPPLLMLHGTGGGFDQGMLMAAPLIAAGFRVIAPSRFGYLRTPMPDRADHLGEAEAMADLLDGLGIARAAVAGVSAGAIPALAFALRFPDRCTALVPVVPAFFLPGRPPVAPWSPAQDRAVRAVLGSDFLFWSAMRLVPDVIIGSVLATDPALVRRVSRTEAARVHAVMAALMPISMRAQGIIYDGVQANRDLALDLAAIRAPTLALACADDRYRTAENARHIAATVAGARAVVFADGGHVWAGRNDAMFAAITAFLRETA